MPAAEARRTRGQRLPAVRLAFWEVLSQAKENLEEERWIHKYASYDEAE